MCSSFLFLLLLIIPNAIHSETLNCGGSCSCTAAEPCIINCIGNNVCNGSNVELGCKYGYPCTILCNGRISCQDAQIIDNGATDITLFCTGGDNACSGNTIFNCGHGFCAVTCDNTEKDSCYNLQINTNNANGFYCDGNCPPTPLPFAAPTTNPTPSPTINPIPSTTTESTPLSTTNPTKYPTSNPTKYRSTINNPTTTYQMESTSDDLIKYTVNPMSNPTNDPTVNPIIINEKRGNIVLLGTEWELSLFLVTLTVPCLCIICCFFILFVNIRPYKSINNDNTKDVVVTSIDTEMTAKYDSDDMDEEQIKMKSEASPNTDNEHNMLDVVNIYLKRVEENSVNKTINVKPTPKQRQFQVMINNKIDAQEIECIHKIIDDIEEMEESESLTTYLSDDQTYCHNPYCKQVNSVKL